MENLTYIREAEKSRALNDLKVPCIIIAPPAWRRPGACGITSSNNLGDPKNLVLFVGYCAAYTLGAQLRSGQSPVNIFGEPHTVRAQVASVDGVRRPCRSSAELSEYVKHLSGDIKRITVIHGEEDQSLALADTLRTLKPGAEVIVPLTRSDGGILT
jgi:metallo-beta-lactamase family protein